MGYPEGEAILGKPEERLPSLQVVFEDAMKIETSVKFSGEGDGSQPSSGGGG